MDFTNEELKTLLETATANFEAQAAENLKIKSTVSGLETQYKTAQTEIESLKSGDDKLQIKSLNESLVELKEEISDLRSKYKAPVAAINDKSQIAALRQVAMKAVGNVVKSNKHQKGDVFDSIKTEIDIQVKSLNISTPAEGGLAVANVLSLDVMDYARETSPIVAMIGFNSGMTRDYSQLIKVTYPGIAEGVEAIAGTVPAETSTQEYVEVKSHTFKLAASPRITNEALYGTDINVYSDLLTGLGEEIAIYLAAQILKGDGTGKNARGILSSNRVDITDGTGESFKPTLTPDGTGARDSDYFPVNATGVSGAVGVDDKSAVDFVIGMTNLLPTRYLARAKWTMNRKSKDYFEKLRDANERPVFSYSYIEGTIGRQFMLNGFPVTIDDTMPDIAVDSNFAIFGDLSKAYAINNGDIDQMILDPYTKKGSLIAYTEKEFFEMVQRSDAILIACATTNSAA